MLNSICLCGRLTRDPEILNTISGRKAAKFSLAVQRNFKNANGEYEADFINCEAWGTTAEFIEKYFRKGNMAAIRGELRTRKYDDNGTTRTYTSVNVSEVTFTEPKRDGGTQSGSKPTAEPPELPDVPDLTDIPDLPDLGYDEKLGF